MRISLGGLVGFLFAAAVSVAATAQTNDTVKARLVNCGQTVSKACIHDWFPTYGTIIIMDAQSPKGPHLCLPDPERARKLDGGDHLAATASGNLVRDAAGRRHEGRQGVVFLPINAGGFFANTNPLGVSTE